MDEEFRSAQEEALYSMLKTVLSNHIVYQRISHPKTLSVSAHVLAFQINVMVSRKEQVDTLITASVTALRTQQQSRTQPPFPSFADYSDAEINDELMEQGGNLGHCPCALPATEYCGRHNLPIAGMWRVCIALYAEMLAAMARFDQGAARWESDEYTDSLTQQLPPLIGSDNHQYPTH